MHRHGNSFLGLFSQKRPLQKNSNTRGIVANFVDICNPAWKSITEEKLAFLGIMGASLTPLAASQHTVVSRGLKGAHN